VSIPVTPIIRIIEHSETKCTKRERRYRETKKAYAARFESWVESLFKLIKEQFPQLDDDDIRFQLEEYGQHCLTSWAYVAFVEGLTLKQAVDAFIGVQQYFELQKKYLAKSAGTDMINDSNMENELHSRAHAVIDMLQQLIIDQKLFTSAQRASTVAQLQRLQEFWDQIVMEDMR
jgi:hypothetical protein